MKKGERKEPMEKDAAEYKKDQKGTAFRKQTKRWIEAGFTKQMAWGVAAEMTRKRKIKENRE